MSRVGSRPLFRSALLAAPAAALAAMAALWNFGPERAAEPGIAVSIAPSGRIIPRQYAALVQLTEEAEVAEGVEGDAARQENSRLRFASDAIRPAASFRVATGAEADHERALQCLTQAIYYEAAREPEDGQRAVAQVVLNRVRHPAFAKTVCGVVYERFDAAVCQFSFVCDGALARRPLPDLWEKARRIAAQALAGKVYPGVGTATHYHADYVFPRWAPHLAKIAQIGAHIFYRWPGGWGLPRAFTGHYAGGEHIPVLDPARFAKLAEPQIDYPSVAALPERRAANDLGGRLDPSKGWKLSIPDPSQTRGSLDTMLAQQGSGAPAGRTMALADGQGQKGVNP
ncbi:cell wall hydrolase [Sphingobium baderi]|uniref:cell wall hydrolase n=1 Tax=Sphingobium baderi TaxID=1332080 RepID=UPI000B26F4D1|nr:cell wall hydrolase [Sphingobium baderi]